MKSNHDLPKPWEKLGLARKVYSANKPWKKAKMKRAEFERILVLMPDEFVQEVKREGEAERLVNAIFDLS